MSSQDKVRVTIDAKLWDAVKAVAAIKGIAPQLYLETALKASLDGVESLNRVAVHAANIDASAVQIADQINVIADFIVDMYREQAQKKPNSSDTDNP
ncbi:hypothetical protein [Microvirga yunnanensis]|uniref:hypothetical protein n=1 Tax=Microvirga yunnanensis TaxID=2953740 RepID=UPI0021C7A350|nr:hypothetical protein [Microvirga sp. HBU65207]